MPRKKPERRCSPDAILQGFDSRVVALAGRVRRLILEMIDGVNEVGYPDRGEIGFHRRDLFATLRPMADHVELGFAYGAALPDFGGVLEGDGELERHVSIRTARALNSFAVKTLLSAALFDDDTHGFRRRHRPAPRRGRPRTHH